MKNNVFEVGPIRPPSESRSLLLRVTQGCNWNKCKFCDIYRDTNFRFTSIDKIKATIDIVADYRDRILSYKTASGRIDHKKIIDDINRLPPDAQNSYYMVYNWIAHGAKSVFLQDANTLAIKPDYLVEILEYLNYKLPGIERITTYGRADSLARIEPDQYRKLNNAGLNRIHSGFESGSDKVLTLINKGVTKAQQIQGGLRAVESGIQLSIYFMPGIGGKELSNENAIETADVINAVNPHFVRLRTSVIKPDSELWELVANKTFTPCNDIEKVREIALMLENVEGCTGTLLSDHIINLLPEINGRLDKDKERMLKKINNFLSLPKREIMRFQLARRAGNITRLSDLNNLDEELIKKIDHMIDKVNDPGEWEDIMHHYLMHYI